MIRALLVCLTIIFSCPTWAFPCFITLAKDNCWTNYDLVVTVKDGGTGKTLTTITVPSGKSWTRVEVACHPAQTLNLYATFSPVFWATDKGKIYPAKRDWLLPLEIKKGITAWSISICYPEMFAEVPMPPEATSNCRCDMASIPPVKPPKETKAST